MHIYIFNISYFVRFNVFRCDLFVGSGWILIICFHTNRSMICCFKEGDYHLIELRARTFFVDNLRFSCSYKRTPTSSSSSLLALAIYLSRAMAMARRLYIRYPNEFIPQRDDLIQIKDWRNVDSNPGRFLSLLI